LPELGELLLPLEVDTEDFILLALLGLSGKASARLSSCVHLPRNNKLAKFN
jgi:hypothetical protein